LTLLRCFTLHHCHLGACQVGNDVVVVTYIYREFCGKACWSVGLPGVVMIERVGLALLGIGRQIVYISNLLCHLPS